MNRFAMLFAVTALVLAVPAAAQTQTPAAPVTYPPYGRIITLAEAKIAVAAAEAEARKNGWNVVVIVVEPTGALVAAEKMDGTQYGSIDVATGKAETAARFRRPTLAFQQAVRDGNLNSIFTGAMALEGGELLIIDGQVVGAIGVSGATAAQDGQIARAGAAAVLK
ncbi:heme-binding protein [Asticcacaulis sp. AC402]|uniref:GlcG/HbpS family heme-binding protein n=1 Tax=Asticcacaulis sp. AC402 TaxID=1282361 RepID=UPI0003C3D597|nr:heme-binding protein [Asticcacaulis sp. AC402]ESQ76270.1 glcG protein [Asticcacaulis sp. AC402]